MAERHDPNHLVGAAPDIAPLAWVIGTPWQDASVVGSLIGQKIVINEFVAYLQLGEIVNAARG